MAEMITIEIKGGEALRGKFKKSAAGLTSDFDKTMGKWVGRTTAKMKKRKYPPERPAQKYIRTGRLGRSWGFNRQKLMVWAIENRAQQKGRIYPKFVIGRNQARIHKGRWWIAFDEIEKLVPGLVDDLKGDIRRALF